jgi:hypothetical protein
LFGRVVGRFVWFCQSVGCLVGRFGHHCLASRSVCCVWSVGRSVVLSVDRSVGSLVGWLVCLVGRSVGRVWSVGSFGRFVASGSSVLVGRVCRLVVWPVCRFVWSIGRSVGRLSS